MAVDSKKDPSASGYTLVETLTVREGTSSDDSSEITPLVEGAANNKPLSKKEEAIGWVQFYALCYDLFLLGWNDGSLGPLLPRIQEFYDVGFATVSWIFVISCMMLIFGCFFQTAAFAAQSLALPFPIFVFSFFFGGIGMAVQDAQANGFVATVKYQAEMKMGFLHAAYGCGALFAPLFATPLSQTKHWSYHYLISFALSIVNVVILAVVFRFKDQDHCLAQAGEIVPDKTEDAPGATYGELLRLKAVHLLALFLLVYIGIEVTIGGWIVSFMLIIRDGGPSSGYVASGFFGGNLSITISLKYFSVEFRINPWSSCSSLGEQEGQIYLVLINPCLDRTDFLPQLGEIHAVYVYTVLVILLARPLILRWVHLRILHWHPPRPLYPIAMNHTSRILPRALVTGAIGWIAACGALGSAVLPFFTGAMASKYGIQSLQPYLVVMMILMGIIWKMVPKTAV
ncbi:hypothetical protein NLJ89_g7482 [Agrocybe chaxingu]|uniref:MFS general substrate transporter n=1 Tax=Agrocybe chaxingu TaxID=84603 RepID=A0A9W8JX45_9AGAR|nr:hypothetical protein NLJ89_g7482 [Agrocybe chaxingu]